LRIGAKAMAKRRNNVTYTPDGFKTAVEALQNNNYHCFEPNDAAGIVKALFHKGFRIIYVVDKN
jgi:hypothetical protein